MEIQPNDLLKRRNYSNSPYIKNIQQSNYQNNIFNNFQQNYSNQNLDSNLGNSDIQEDDSNNIEPIKLMQKLNEKDIVIEELRNTANSLYDKVKKEKLKNNIKQKANETLEEQINILNKNIIERMMNYNKDSNSRQFDLDSDNLYGNNLKNNNYSQRAYSVKSNKLKKIIKNNFIDNDNEDNQYYFNNNINNTELINLYKRKINDLLNENNILKNDIFKKKDIIKQLNFEIKNLKTQLKELENKYILISENYNLMAISSLQNKNNININNYKIRNNNKNNLNYNDIKCP